MNTKLILVEGLPGSGKSTGARMVYDILKEQGKDVHLVLEGDVDHPADYEGVAIFTPQEWEALCDRHKSHQTLINRTAFYEEGNYFLSYRKMQQDDQSRLPNSVYDDIFKQDIYEISYERNMELIASKWKRFGEAAAAQKKIYVFECCFIQNPVTVSMVKHNRNEEESIQYVRQLEEAISSLNPMLIYMDQKEYDITFKKAVEERPTEWSSGFMDYYTQQGYGQVRGYSGMDGTLQVLYARKQLEQRIMNELSLPRTMIDNSQYDREQLRQELLQTLLGH
ncbi:hypothetical protein [Paenibacillus glacialis]|uniref:Uncharacterized protein n=1 Tax=Paenibacillus glacialis TaxID=494026 RepID=A0A162K5K6_9BACL|nr:hypothetical protein [Paenibacillus glacialis]OAB43346.1 hypothetical protein PGLA_08855 [Paenibacillus glacialis]